MINLIGMFLLPLFMAAYLPACLLPPIGSSIAFPARREVGAGIVVMILIPLLLHITPEGFGAWIDLLLWAWILPVVGVGIAGRRPFRYGLLVGLAYLIVLTILNLPATFRTAPEDRHVVWDGWWIWVAISLTVSLLSVAPIALYWRAKANSDT